MQDNQLKEREQIAENGDQRETNSQSTGYSTAIVKLAKLEAPKL
jgi:hypothetical protein